jgi:hypothetical protein
LFKPAKILLLSILLATSLCCIYRLHYKLLCTGGPNYYRISQQVVIKIFEPLIIDVVVELVVYY